MGGEPAISSSTNAASFALQPEELAFMKALTKINDEEQLRAHIQDVQKEAYEIYSYHCIRKFAFVKLNISSQPGYYKAMSVCQSRRNAILLDIGCCFGNDVRKAVYDGWPVDQVIASDLRREFWDYGHKLFLSDPKTFPVKFVAGDILNPSTLSPRGPYINPDEISAILAEPIPLLSELQSLTPLQGKVSAIHACSLFHLFSEENQLNLARHLASLLRPEKGSVIFGRHVGKEVKGFRPPYIGRLKEVTPMFCHSPESWKDMWIHEIFAGPDGKGHERIQVDVEFTEQDWVTMKELFGEVGPDNGIYMQWSSEEVNEGRLENAFLSKFTLTYSYDCNSPNAPQTW